MSASLPVRVECSNAQGGAGQVWDADRAGVSPGMGSSDAGLVSHMSH